MDQDNLGMENKKILQAVNGGGSQWGNKASQARLQTGSFRSSQKYFLYFPGAYQDVGPNCIAGNAGPTFTSLVFKKDVLCSIFRMIEIDSEFLLLLGPTLC